MSNAKSLGSKKQRVEEVATGGGANDNNSSLLWLIFLFFLASWPSALDDIVSVDSSMVLFGSGVYL